MDLKILGITHKNFQRNLSPAQLIEICLSKNEGALADTGALITSTGECTGRSPQDRFIVKRQPSDEKIWWGDINRPVSEASFDIIKKKLTDFLNEQHLYVTDTFCGADPTHRLSVRFVTNKAWHSHFLQNMFIMPNKHELESFKPDFYVMNGSGYFEKDFKKLGLRTEKFILVDIERRLIIIGGTEYSGEMKKGIFGIMNYLLPLKGVMPMHCSANHGKDGDSAIFFGLSGTGKTTLSTDPHRNLIGDDEHGWTDQGIFNFEGGCYAKCINLSYEKEPDIWDAIKFGAILENVTYDKHTRKVNYDDGSITENTRVSYPIDYIHNYEPTGRGAQPSKVIFLTCDAFGIFPPVSILTPEQASYHFLSGYTAKIAGTERGITEPQSVFSPCFGAPFMLHKPEVYGDLLAQRLKANNSRTYLINTGWCKGSYGVGERISLKATRRIIDFILDGKLDKCPTEEDKELHINAITSVPEIDNTILKPSQCWKDKAAYAKQREKLIAMFKAHHEKIKR